MFLVPFILVSQKRMQLRCTRMDSRRWQRSRSQVRQRRQCLWAAPTRHAAAPDAQPCAAGDPRARAVLWARRQAVRGVRSCAALLIGSEASLQPSHPARWEAHLTRRVAQARDGRRRHPSGPDQVLRRPAAREPPVDLRRDIYLRPQTSSAGAKPSSSTPGGKRGTLGEPRASPSPSPRHILQVGHSNHSNETNDAHRGLRELVRLRRRKG